MKTPDETARPSSPAADPGWVRRVIRGLKSIRFAIVLMALIAAASIVGTLIEQGLYLPEAAIARYGRVVGSLIVLLGLNHLYVTWWFLGLLGLLALSVAACTFSGVRFTLRKSFSLITHASILLIVAGAILRGIAGVDGMLTIEKGKTIGDFEVEDAAARTPLGFQVRLDDFVVRYYDDAHDALEVRLEGTAQARSIPREVGKVVQLRADGTSVEVLRYFPDFKMDENSKFYSASNEPLNPAVEVRFTGPAGESTQWLFSKYPDLEGHGKVPAGIKIKYVWHAPTVKAFESHVTILDAGGKEVQNAVILVNSPLKVGPYTFYQVSYDPETLASTLEVTRDPGVPLVFAGFLLLPIGVALAFYAKPLLNRKGRADA
ncbi:MAG: cytochrome c biogenesis protein ResB [Candidatus Brocadiia bacterium]|jgi:cytochrome c biogenesis protein ResB